MTTDPGDLTGVNPNLELVTIPGPVGGTRSHTVSVPELGHRPWPGIASTSADPAVLAALIVRNATGHQP